MAKRTRTITAPPVDLDKVLDVNGTLYNVNAVHADEATKVTQPLVIKQQVTAKKANKILTYDGSAANEADATVVLVPASGGTFTGAISVPADTVTDLDNTSTDANVINKGDIKNLVKDLKGVPGWSWNGNILGQLDPDSESLSKLDMIVGEEAALADLLAASNAPDSFIYFCTDDDEASIYLRINGAAPIRVGTVATKLLGESVSYDADSITTKFNETKSYIDQEIDKLGIDSSNSNTAIAARLTKIENGTTVVPKSAHANTADSCTGNAATATTAAACSGNSATATTAAKATADASGNTITTYYQKKITVANRTPNSWEGANGDIWISYS